MTQVSYKAVNPWLIAVTVLMSAFMEVLDTTVINVTLPHIAGNLSATYNQATWVVTSYLVSNAIILPMTGWLARHFGRKRLLMASVGGFTLSSIACGLAPNLGLLIFFRILQGATGGGLQPLSQSIMLEAFPPQKRGKAMAAWGLCIVVAPMLGPVLGGWLTDSYSWRWVFYINVPIGILSMFMVKMNIFDPDYIRAKANETVDYLGMLLLIVGIGSLQIFLDKGQEDDWFSSRFITTLAVLMTLGILGFIVREMMTEHPVVDLRVMHHRSYTAGLIMITAVGFALYGSLMLLPQWLQMLMGYSAMKSGLATLPRGLGAFLFMPITGILLSRYDPRKLLFVGFAVSGASMFWLGALSLDAGYWELVWPQVFQGAAMSMMMVPLSTIISDSISKEKMGNATSLFNLMRNIGGSVGVAMIGTVYVRRTQADTQTLGAHVTAYSVQTQQLLASVRAAIIHAGSDPATAVQQAYQVVFLQVQRQAAMVAFVKCFQIMGFMFFFMIPLILLMKKLRHLRDKDEQERLAQERLEQLEQ